MISCERRPQQALASGSADAPGQLARPVQMSTGDATFGGVRVPHGDEKGPSGDRAVVNEPRRFVAGLHVLPPMVSHRVIGSPECQEPNASSTRAKVRSRLARESGRRSVENGNWVRRSVYCG